MAWTWYDNASTGVLSGTQNTIIGDMSGSFVDLPGCSVTLTQGTWLVMCHFHFRCWQSNTTYAKSAHTYALTDSSNNIINGCSYSTYVDANTEQQSSCSTSLMTTYNVPSGTVTLKLRGASSMIASVNFASGFRWDSGPGNPSTIRAVKVGG